MKRARPKQHKRRLKSGKTIVVNKGRTKRKARKQNYGFMGKKKSPELWLELNDPEYLAESKYNHPDNPTTYGKVKKISGKAVGRGVTASGAIVPVVLPLPLMAAAGTAIEKKVDNFKLLLLTDEHDKLYKVPKIEMHLKKKKNYGSSPELKTKILEARKREREMFVNDLKSAMNNGSIDKSIMDKELKAYDEDIIAKDNKLQMDLIELKRLKNKSNIELINK